MIKILKQFFSAKRTGKPDFSTFFNSASVEAQRKLMESVARKANADQRALLEQYERMKPKTT